MSVVALRAGDACFAFWQISSNVWWWWWWLVGVGDEAKQHARDMPRAVTNQSGSREGSLVSPSLLQLHFDHQDAIPAPITIPNNSAPYLPPAPELDAGAVEEGPVGKVEAVGVTAKVVW